MMESITVLHIISSSNIGGSPKHTLLLCQELEKLGCQPVLVFPKGGSYENTFLDSGIKCYPLNKITLFDEVFHKSLKSIIKNEHVDIIHTHELRADLLGFIVGKQTHLPVVTTSHNMITKSRLSPIKKIIYFRISKKIYNSISRTLAVSQAVHDNLIDELHIKPNKVITIPNGTKIIDPVELKSAAEVRSSLHIPLNTPLLICIGRLIPIQKGQEYLIKAMKDVLNRYPSTHLLIVGDGIIRSDLDELSRSLNVQNNVHFSGWRNDINDLLNACDICVVPSLWDPLPRIVLEAMMVAKPVVASNVDGIKEAVIHEETGLLVEPKNSLVLSDSICRLLDNPDYLRQMGVNGRKRVLENFTSIKHAQKTLDIYKICIKEYT